MGVPHATPQVEMAGGSILSFFPYTSILIIRYLRYLEFSSF